MGAIIIMLHNSKKWVVLTKLQWVALYIYIVSCNFATCGTQNLSCKASCKTFFFFIVKLKKNKLHEASGWKNCKKYFSHICT